MSATKKADRRLVNPKDKHYIENGGIRYFVGPYTIEQRQQFIDVMVSLYKTRFPDASYKQAKAAGFHKWRNYVIITIQDERLKHVETSSR